MGIELFSIEGLFFFNEEESLPVYIFFLPIKVPKESCFKMNVKNILSEKKQRFYYMCFQNIKRILSGIQGELSGLQYLPTSYNQRTNMKMSAAKLTFAKVRDSTGIAEDNTIYEVDLGIDKEIYPVEVQELPLGYGYLKLFEAEGINGGC